MNTDPEETTQNPKKPHSMLPTQSAVLVYQAQLLQLNELAAVYKHRLSNQIHSRKQALIILINLYAEV